MEEKLSATLEHDAVTSEEKNTTVDEKDNIPVLIEKEAEKKRKLQKLRHNQRKKRQNLLRNKEVGSKIKGRLIITHIELENFKSYAGVKVIGPFHKCFSAVVGPNGSGKSNVIDAMLFVFGKRAKKLRLKKVSQLIHKSSEHPGCTFARVTVFFKNIHDIDKENLGDNLSQEEQREGYKSIPNTEIAVTRYAYDTNKSEYYLDDRKVTFKEVYDLLIQRGIDLHQNRFLILQGEVEQISLMKPKKKIETDDDGLLEYLEDIIGSNKYIDAIEDKQDEFEQVELEKNEKVNLIKIAEKEMFALEEEKSLALKYLEKERELLVHRHYFIQNQISLEKEIFITKKSDLLILEEEKRKTEQLLVLDSVEKGLSITENIEKLQTKINQKNGEISTIVKKHKKLERTLTEFEKQEINAKENIVECKKQIKSISKKITNATKKFRKCESDLENMKKELEDKQKSKLGFENQLLMEEKKLEVSFKTLAKETKPLREKLEAMQVELEPKMEERTSIKNSISFTKTELDILGRASREAQKEIDEIQNKKLRIQEDSKKFPEDIKSIENLLNDLKSNKEIIRQKIDSKVIAEDLLEKKIQRNREKIANSNQLKYDMATKDSLSKELLEIQEHKNINFQLIGRVGDIAKIDSKYDVAISTACGSLNYLVVKTAGGAEECIKYLKKHKLGRASFASLDKLEYLKNAMTKSFEHTKFQEMGVVRLFDLINFSSTIKYAKKYCAPRNQADLEHWVEKIKTVFYLGLKDTLVASNLDIATKVAFGKDGKRFRVVTLDGKLIEINGAMSGGGTRQLKGLIKLVDKNETLIKDQNIEEGVLTNVQVKEIESKISRDLDKATAIRTKRQSLEIKLTKIEGEVARNIKQKDDMELNMSAFVQELKSFASRIKVLKKDVNLSCDDLKKKVQLEVKLKKFESDLDKNKKDCTQLENECNDLEKKIENVGGSSLQVLKEKVSLLRQELKIISDAVINLCLEISNTEATKSNTKKVLDLLEEDNISFEIELAEATTSLETLGNNIQDINTEISVSESERKLKNQELSLEQNKLSQLKNLLNEVKSKLVNVENQIDNVKADMSKVLDKQNGLEQKLAQIHQEFAKNLPSNFVPEQIGNRNTIIMNLNEENEYDNFQELLSIEKLVTDQQEIKNLICDLTNHIATFKKRQGSKLRVSAIKDYCVRRIQYEQKLMVLNEISKKCDAVQQELDTLKKRRLNEFMKGYQEISISLKALYQMLTLGGDADLDLVDSLDPFTEGVTFSVRPPKKSWKDIRNLSGGEKTLSSLALVFALHKYEPNALYVMDEIDAALDFRNVSIVGNYLKEQTKDAQFIVISLRNNMFELADRLVGIYKTNNATKSITIDPCCLIENTIEQRHSSILTEVSNNV